MKANNSGNVSGAAFVTARGNSWRFIAPLSACRDDLRSERRNYAKTSFFQVRPGIERYHRARPASAFVYRDENKLATFSYDRNLLVHLLSPALIRRADVRR